MTAYEIGSLVISAFAAVGTIGAVAIALWATLKKDENFKIHSIRAFGTRRMDMPDNEVDDAAVFMLIENKLPAPMKIHPMRLEFENTVPRVAFGYVKTRA
ncbi:MAG: hypothetical protein JKY55_20420 [Aliivibrio sp.]|uniref:hypothetical protein n=1 Tax=Aliivibrio sp. TaxID=1872443 RepID=UPI001A44A578|nr:hypothetical protein [Aliivibrio sp.]